MTLLRAASFVLLPTLTLGTVVLTGSARPLRAAARALPTAPTARIVGVMVNPALIESDDSNGFPTLAFQGTMAQTKLAIVVESAEGGIIGLDRDASEVASFSDDTGKSLLEEDSAFGPFGFGDRVLDEGRILAVEVDGKHAPAAAAKSIAAKGSLAVRVAHEKRTVTSEKAEWKKGAEIVAGEFAFSVEANRKAEWGDGFELELQTNGDLAHVVSYVAIEADGTRTELDQNSSMTFGNTTRITLRSDAQVAGGQLEVLYWHGAKVVDVPLEVRAAAGFE